MNETLYCYQQTPLDDCWGALRTVSATAEFLARADEREGYPSVGDFVGKWGRALGLARRVGWDGTITGADAVFWLPTGDNYLTCGFVFKQSDDGGTFVVSPYPLPWVEEGAFASAVCPAKST